MLIVAIWRGYNSYKAYIYFETSNIFPYGSIIFFIRAYKKLISFMKIWLSKITIKYFLHFLDSIIRMMQSDQNSTDVIKTICLLISRLLILIWNLTSRTKADSIRRSMIPFIILAQLLHWAVPRIGQEKNKINILRQSTHYMCVRIPYLFEIFWLYKVRVCICFT